MNQGSDSLPKPSNFSIYIAIALLYSVAVIPNVLREVKLVLVILLVPALLKSIRLLPSEATSVLSAGTAITLFYLAIGYNRAEHGSFINVFAVYIVGPWFWVLVGFFLNEQLSNGKWRKLLLGLAVASAATVFLYYLIYLTLGPRALDWLIADPNLTQSERGVFEARLHVAGSLIFLVPAILAVPEAVRSSRSHAALCIFLIAAAVATGRGALLAATVFGIACYFIRQFSKGGVHAFSSVAVAMVTIVIAQWLASVTGIDLINTISEFREKALLGGGAERIDQAIDLWRGILGSYFMGVGHGVSSNVIRSETALWRYELLPLATVYRTGLIGLLVYALPVALSVYRMFKFRDRLSDNYVAVMMSIGLTAMVLGTTTNPYLESIDFQWTLFLPYCYLLAVARSAERSSVRVRR